MIRIDDILARVARNHPDNDLNLIRRAYLFAAKSHKGQKRDSGDPYLTHPLEVASILADMRMDAVTVSVGLLHDVVEDTLSDRAELELLFGPEITQLVDGVTKISQIEFSSKEEKQAANFRKLLLALSNDIRVIVVKFADRLHNMRTLHHKRGDRRVAISEETLNIYAPLAHRLGLGKIRSELEDLSFRHLDPKAYDDLRMQLESKKAANAAFLSSVTQSIQAKMAEAGIPCRTESRIKRLYSIYQKLRRQNITMDQVYDLMAVRIITEDQTACYHALGIINTSWPPIPDRIKDYIGIPRPNGYRSLHTVVNANGQPFEVQIRTEEMHRVAEEGIAAHWKYKDGRFIGEVEEQMVKWLRNLVAMQQDITNPREFMATLRMDLFEQEVQTFTPKGTVISLPRDATPVDFAYAIHSEVGNSCYGAKVNGRMVPLKTKLRNGDHVEIITQPGRTPSRDWLSYVKTARARHKIRHWLSQIERQKSAELGRKLLEKEARKYKLNLREILESPAFLTAAADYGCRRVDDALSAVGIGRISARPLLAKAAPGGLGDPAAESRITSTVRRVLGLGDHQLKVKGFEDVLVFRAKCCNPIPGETVIGYITRGKGIAVHSKSCRNVESSLLEPERWIDVDWGAAPVRTSTYKVPLTVVTEDRPGILAAVSSAIASAGVNIPKLEGQTSDERGMLSITVEIPNMKYLERIIANIRDIDGVREVTRNIQAPN